MTNPNNPTTVKFDTYLAFVEAYTQTLSAFLVEGLLFRETEILAKKLVDMEETNFEFYEQFLKLAPSHSYTMST